MKLVGLIILLGIFTSSDSLKCATTNGTDPLTMSLNNLVLNNVLGALNGLSFQEYQTDKCHIKFCVSYDQELLEVQFTEHLMNSTVGNETVRIDTYVIDIVDDIGVQHDIEYACSTDLCEIEFVNKSTDMLDWLLQNQYSELVNELIPLIFGDDGYDG